MADINPNLSSKLDHWQKAGLISAKQAKAIAAFEASAAASDKRPWVAYGFATLGAVALGTGIISLIAANWELIPIWLKLAVDGILLIATAALAIFFRSRNKAIGYEVTLLVFMLLCLGSIGLISQVFHVVGSVHGAMLFWCLITCGVFFISRHFFNIWLWLGALALGAIAMISSLQLPEPIALYLGLAIPLLYGLSWLLTLSVSPSFVNHHRALGIWSVLGIGGYLTAAGYVLDGYTPIAGKLWLPIAAAGLTLIAVLLLALWLRTPKLRHIQKYLLSIGTMTLAVPFAIYVLDVLFDLNLSSEAGLAYDLLCSLALLVLLGIMAMLMVSFGRKRWFHVCVVLMGLKFIEFYLQAFGGLMMTGIGLVFSGALLMGAVWLWSRYRKPLEAWTEEFVS